MKALNIIVLLGGLFAAVNSYAAGTVLMEKHGAAWPQSQNGYAKLREDERQLADRFNLKFFKRRSTVTFYRSLTNA